MKEKYLKIRQKVQTAYKAIEKANEDLKLLRKVCDHPESEMEKDVEYSWRIGSTCKADICGVCGEVIETEFSKMNKDWKIAVNTEEDEEN